MIKLGKKNECFGVDKLKELNIWGKPNCMPSLEPGESLICELDFIIYQDLYVAENMDDVNQLYNFYEGGWALGIKWYTGEDVGFITIITDAPK